MTIIDEILSQYASELRDNNKTDDEIYILCRIKESLILYDEFIPTEDDEIVLNRLRDKELKNKTMILKDNHETLF